MNITDDKAVEAFALGFMGCAHMRGIGADTFMVMAGSLRLQIPAEVADVAVLGALRSALDRLAAAGRCEFFKNCGWCLVVSSS